MNNDFVVHEIETEKKRFAELLEKENLSREEIMKMSGEDVMAKATKLIQQTYGIGGSNG